MKKTFLPLTVLMATVLVAGLPDMVEAAKSKSSSGTRSHNAQKNAQVVTGKTVDSKGNPVKVVGIKSSYGTITVVGTRTHNLTTGKDTIVTSKGHLGNAVFKQLQGGGTSGIKASTATDSQSSQAAAVAQALATPSFDFNIQSHVNNTGDTDVSAGTAFVTDAKGGDVIEGNSGVTVIQDSTFDNTTDNTIYDVSSINWQNPIPTSNPGNQTSTVNASERTSQTVMSIPS